MPLRNDLRGLRVFVTGAASGIGVALISLSRDDGATLACLARDAREAEALSASVAPAPVLVRDLASGGAGLACEAARLLGGLDAVALAAGVFDHRASTETDSEAWAAVLAVNLTAVFEIAREALPLLGPGGSLVLVSSQIGLVGHPRAAAYTASKAALNGLAKSLALEAAPRGVRVNAVAPGPVVTPMTAVARADDERAARLRSSIPLGRFGEAEEIAQAIRFLLSPAAGFITGTVLVADGGVTAA
jgi:NAD(P)-dependent dehydrogenase (short-subunit alcohol dehydrogenase family)